MGLTYSWDSATPNCNTGTAVAGDWVRLLCSTAGDVVDLNLDSAGLVRKDFPSDIAKLLGLTSVAMPWNFLDGNLGTYVKYFSVLTNLQVVAMQYMYFSGSFPSVFINLPSLTALALRFNYLTGTVPTAITKIKSLDLYSNYLVGSIPTGTWSFCNSGSNCFASTSSCAGSQRAVTACAICGSTDGTGTLCGGTKLCVPDADTAIASKVNNYGAQVALYCSALYMNAGDAAALLNIKTAMGLTFTNWATTVPCRLEGNAAGANEWDRVSCTSDGRLYSIAMQYMYFSAAVLLNIKTAMGLTFTNWATTNPCRLEGASASAGEWDRVSCTADRRLFMINLDSMNLVRKSFPSDISNLTGLGMVNLDSMNLVRKSFPSGISNLTGLGMVWMPWNFIDGNLETYLKDFSALTNLKTLVMPWNFIDGSLADYLKDFSTLTNLNTLALRFNYLTGTVPTAITKLKSLDLYSNYLVGSIPTGTWSFCNSGSNCFASTGSCAGSQRAVTANLDSMNLVRKSFPSDISNLTGLGMAWMPWNFIDGNLETYLKDFSALTNLKTLNLDSMNLVRKSFPSGISNLTGLGMVTFRFNYLTGTVPTAITKFKSLDLYSNYLVGSIPTGTWSFCNSGSNCFASTGSCAGTQRAVTDCAICGSTDGAGTLCGGRACIPDADARISGQRRLCSTSRQPWGSPSPTGPPRFLAASRAMLLALTSGTVALRFNYLTGTVPTAITKLKSLDLYSNYLVGSIPTGTWSFCNSGSNCFASTGSCAGSQRAVTANLDSMNLVRKSFPSDISNLTGLGMAWMPWNFIDGNLETYLKDFSALTNLKTLNLDSMNLVRKSFPSGISNLTGLGMVAMQYMYFSGSFPSVLMNLPSLTSVTFRFNYLTGTVPTAITKFKSLDLYSNYLVGSIPTGTWSFCNSGSNCFASTGSCAGTQRAVTDCAICGSTDGAGTLCAAALLNIKTAMGLTFTNWATTVPCRLEGNAAGANEWDPAALLNIKTAMGLTFTNWATTVPCRLEGNAAGANEWDRVSCTSDGRLYSINLDSMNLVRKSFPSGISNLTGLGMVAMQYMYFSGSFPSILMSLPSLTNANLDSMNLVRKSFPSGISNLTGLGMVWMPWNFIDGNLETYLKDFSALTNLKTLACIPDADARISGQVKNSGAQVALYCSVLYMNAGDAAALLNIKTAMGLTFTNWATTVPCRLEGNAAGTNEWDRVSCTSDGRLYSIAMQYMYFSGSFPSILMSLPSLTNAALRFNYLTGTVPTAITKLKSLDLYSNYLVGSIPTGTWSFCNSGSNCFASTGSCAGSQRAATDCAFCGSTNGAGTLCGGKACIPDADARISGQVKNFGAQVALYCYAPYMDAGDAVVLMALKSSLGVTLTNWNAAAHCTLEGQTPLPSHWGGVQCAAGGHVLSIALNRQGLQGYIHPNITQLTTLTYLDLGYNLFQSRLDLFAAPLKSMTTLKALFFHYNYFAGPIPSTIALLPQLTSLGLFSNYLTGTVPIPSKALLALDVGFNYLSGSFPKLPLMFCAGDNNCFLNSTACRTYGIVQRPGGACAICGSVAAQGDLCFGGSCAPSATAAVSAGTVNSPNEPLLPMSCRDNPATVMDTGSALALLNVKSALGVTFTSWNASVPCSVFNSTITVGGTWTGVLCSAAGAVLSVNLSSTALTGSMHADISKLSALTYLDLSNNVLRASLDNFTAPFSGLKALQQLRLNNNWFAGTLPQILVSLPALTLLDVHANALTGSLPGVSAALLSFFLHDNFLVGNFSGGALTACDASLNCLTSAAACGASSTSQRVAAACAICDSAAAQGLLCWGGTCLPNVTASTSHPDGNAPQPMYCSGAPVVTISTADAEALLVLKSALNISYATWAAATFCTVAPTPVITGTWNGILCDSLGKVVALQLPNTGLTGTLPAAVSNLTALTAIDLTSNLFQGRLDEVTTQLRFLTNLKAIDLAYNWFSGSVPAFMLALPKLTELTLGYNYLTGSLVAVAAPLSVVDVQFNFLAGSFPALNLSLCAGRMNCFLDATKCKNPTRVSEVQRATASCAICNTTNAQGRLCNGGLCTVNATDLVSLGAPNSASSPLLPLICVGATFVAMDATHAGAMLNLKASLGVTLTDWKADSPCSLTGTAAPGSWSGVSCDGTGKVTNVILKAQNLAGSIHSDISKLTTLTSLDLQSNLLQGRVDSFTASIKAPLVLKELALQYNYLVGAFPSTLLALTTLSKLSVAFNYLTGSLPAVPASAKSLDVQGNFLAGAFPTNALTYCASTTNCLTDGSNCASVGISQRSGAECAICGTSFAQGTLCGGVTCFVNTTGVTTPPTASSPPRNLFCAPVPVDTTTTTTLLALKTVLGVTLTDWSATTVVLKPKALNGGSVPLATTVGACTVDGQIPAPGSWTGVFCSPTGAIVALVLPNQKLSGSFSSDITKLTALTGLDLSGNLFQQRFEVFVSLFTALKALKSLSLQYNWFSNSIPSTLLALPALSSVKLNRNYLTGVVPAIGTAVKSLNVANNFLSGTFPTAALTACDARSNCFLDASKCANANGTLQRAIAECAICGSTNAAGVLCGGGFCTPNATELAGTGTANVEGQAVLPLFCQGGPIEMSMRDAMLNLKASLGVTFTDWATPSPCTIAGQPVVPGAWSNVVCDTAGKVTSIDLKAQLLRGSMHADISKLTTLTSLILEGNLLQGRLALFTSGFKGLSALKLLNVRLNWFSGVLPSTLVTLPTLSTIDVSYNYMTGSVPALGTALKTLNLAGNFFSGSIGTLTSVLCSAQLNCLLSQGSCTASGTANRLGCNICGSTSGQGTLCSGGLCVPNATVPVASNSPPTVSSPALPMYCTGTIIDTTAAAALGNIKTALGVTFTDWVAPTALLKPKAAVGSGSVALTDWMTTGGYCTVEGQAPVAGSWSGVFCNSLGQPVSLNLSSQKLGGSLHSDLSKLSLLTSLDLSSNFFRAQIDTWGVSLKLLTTLQSLRLNSNYLYGSLPSWFVSFAKLTNLEVNMNVLMGTFPAITSTVLKRLLADQNYFGGTFPANTLTYCTAYYNCISNYTSCSSLSPNNPIPSVGCQFCGTTNALGTACQGNPCVPATPSPITAVNIWNPVPFLRCDPVRIDATHAPALAAISPGLWSSQTTCTLVGQTTVPGSFPLVYCNVVGQVLEINFAYIQATGSIPSDVSKLATLTKFDLSGNLFSGRLDAFLAPFLPLKALNVLRFNNNYFSGSFPSTFSALSALTELKVQLNYLTGSLPAALPASLKSIDASSNYLVGTFPTISATFINCATNCFQDPSKCAYGTVQRPSPACAICETSNGTGRLCSGGICAPNATAAVAAGMLNEGTASMYCLGAAMDPAMAAALLNMKASLGVTFTDWALDTPCTIQGLPPMPGTWSNVICNVTGKVVQLSLGGQRLTGTMHSDIAKLTSLTNIDFNSNLLEGRFDVFAANFKALTSLKEAFFDFNWFTGPIPSSLVAIATLSKLGASYNYLYGAMPTPGAALKSLNVQGNWLSGTFPGSGFVSCNAFANCFTNMGGCVQATSLAQRAASACAVCNSIDGTGTICGGGICAPDTSLPLSNSSPNTAVSPILPRFCVGVGLDATQGNVLLALKTALGVTFTDWTAATLATPKASPTKPKAGSKQRRMLARGSGMFYSWASVGSCTIQGQTPIAGSWTGVRCSPAGLVVSLDLRSRLLSGTVHSDISKLSTLTSLYLTSNLFFNRLDSYVVPLTPTASLKELYINFNWFYGTVPATLLNMPALSVLLISNNYLTGVLPKPGAAIKALGMEFNFLSGTFPAATLAYCSSRSNCFLDAAACFSLDGSAQRDTGCNVCGSANGQLPLCGGAVCTPDPSAYMASQVPNSATAPTLALKCLGMPLDAVSSSALLNIGSALGVTHTDWSASSTCNILGQSSAPKSWPGVWCSGTGVVVSLMLNNMKLWGTIHADMTKLTGVTYLHLGYNLLSGGLSSFVSNITPLTALAVLNLNFNYLYDSVPSTLLNMASLTEMHLDVNYLTGTLPAISTKIKYLAVNHNFLAGSFPAQAFQFCDVRNNCFASVGSCINADGVAQRATGCNICTTAAAVPPLCNGAACVLNASVPLAAGSLNDYAAPIQPFYCRPATIDATAAQALLVLKAALGVAQSSWLVDSPCNVAGNPPVPGSWVGVACDLSGQVVSLDLPSMGLRGSLPADVSKLSAITRINLESNLLEARLGEWASVLTTLKALKHLALNYNWFSGLLPSYLLALSSLTTLNLQFNYLTGTITGAPAVALKSVNVASNFLGGSFPASSTTMCDARSNCLVDASKCVSSGSSAQRAAAACAICGYANASTLLCGGGVCAPNTSAPLASKMPNSASAAVLPLMCTGVRIDPAALPVLANLKTALGVPHAEWGTATMCTVTGVTKGPGEMGAVYCNAGGAVVDLYLKQRGMRGTMHPDISKLTALTALDVSSNFLSGLLDPYFSPLSALTNLQYLVLQYNFFSGPIPSTVTAIKSLFMLSLGWNYLTGTVPALGATVKSLNLENNYLVGTFPTATWTLCTARANCFTDPTKCNANNGQGVTQRPSCAICGSADGRGTLCGGTAICQPDPAAVNAATAIPTTTTPALALMCPPPPPVATDAAAATALLNIKSALGVTYTNWAAGATCTSVGSTGAGGFTGVECNALGNPVKITLDSQKLFGILHGDITKLTALTFISLKSNLFKSRLEDFAVKIPTLPNLAVLLLDFNWFFGSLPPALVGMASLTRLGISYNYLTYRVPPLSPALKDIDMSSNFLSGTFPTNSATSCGAASNCLLNAASCTTKVLSTQRASGCNICSTSSVPGQGMLCLGRGICTVNASVPFNAQTPNTASAAILPLTCVDLVCGSVPPVVCPNDWRCFALQCIVSYTNCIGYLCI
ncbi:hypothetical protein CLOP_g22417 [Closterium sp. NIES-67]|nr:hypothetical protein CLOP_g22417 [Closterium sp. NIES-67]